METRLHDDSLQRLISSDVFLGTHPEATLVQASLHYLDPMLERPRFYVHHRELDNVQLTPRSIVIEDAREHEAVLGDQGFCLVPHKSRVSNLRSRKELLRTYRHEIEELICKLTGASCAIAAPLPVLRVADGHAKKEERTVHRPIRMVHSDHTAASAESYARTAFGEEAAKLIEQRRHVLYHTWRVLSPAPHDTPLALCDGRTICDEDRVAADTVMDFPGTPRRIMETTLFHFSPRHEWFYFPDMRPDELVIFKDFDSDPGQVLSTPHTAFNDARCPTDAPPRESLDLQVLAVF